MPLANGANGAATTFLPLQPSSPVWYGLGLGGSLFGAPTASIARGPGGGTHYTVVPLPVLPPGDVTMQRRADAFAATYAGRMEDAVDLYRLSVEEDGWMAGLLKTMAHGILACDLTWKGSTPEVRSALADADGTPGDWGRMHPENELAKMISDLIGIGLGLGQYVLMCWLCDGIEWTVEAGATPAHVDRQKCKRCKRYHDERPVGSRVLYQLCFRDPRWLWRNTVTGQWRYTGRQGQVDVNPGDGEWVLLESVPDTDVWRHGPWITGTIAAIFARDSTFDRQATSAVCAPTPVFKAVGGTAQDTRKDVEAQADNLRFQNKVVLPGEWDFRIEAAKAEFVDVTDSIVTWASTMWAVLVTGNAAAIKPATGFANLDFYAVTERARRRFLASTIMRQLATQGLRWYIAENFGPGVAVPVGTLDTRSPADKLAASEADIAEGKALQSLRDGADAVGYELEPGYVEERMQAKGIRVRPKVGGHPASRIVLGVDGVNASVLGIEARAVQGLPPFGDARDRATVAALLDAAKGAAAPGSPAPPAPPVGDPAGSTPLPSPPSTPEPPSAAPAGGEGSPPPARVERDEEQDDPDEDDEEARAKLASDLTAAGRDRCACKLLRAHVCPRCGVRRVYGLDLATREPMVAWRAIRRAAKAA